MTNVATILAKLYFQMVMKNQSGILTWSTLHSQKQ